MRASVGLSNWPTIEEGPTISPLSLSTFRARNDTRLRSVYDTYPAATLIGLGTILAVADPAEASWILVLYTLGSLVTSSFTSIPRPSLDALTLLTALSLALLYSIDTELALRQSAWFFIGSLVCACIRLQTLRWLSRHGTALLTFGILILILTAFYGAWSSGARSWIKIGTYTLQPIEFVKILFLVAWASSGDRSRAHHGQRFVFQTLLTLALIPTLILQRDLGPLLILAATCWLWAYWQGTKRRLLAASALLFAGVAHLFPLYFSHVAERFTGWLAPWSDPFGSGYQTLQTRFALSQGGLTGLGWNGGIAHLPAAATDLPLIALVERIGLFGGVYLFCLVLYILAQIYSHSRLVQGRTERRFVIGAWLLLCVQTAVAWAGSVGAVPLVGITFPFLSYGGSSLITNMILLGLIGAARMTRSSRGGIGGNLSPWQVPLWLLIMTLPLLYWVVIEGPKTAAHPHFRARKAVAAEAPRGGIVSRYGESLTEGVSPVLRQPVTRSLIHTVGYVHPRFGTSGLERRFDDWLSGYSPKEGLVPPFGTSLPRWSVRTTIDLRLQQSMELALGDSPGAVVVLDPWSGAVLAMVSSPGTTVAELGRALEQSSEAPLLNRAVQGLYPPGSSFKPVVLAAALEYGLVSGASELYDSGALVVDGYRIENAGGAVLGHLSLQSALAHSSNVLFAHLATQVGEDALRRQAAALGIGQEYDLAIPYRTGQLGRLDSALWLAAAGIGQGEVLVTPLEMATVAATIANGGYRVYPHLVLSLNSESQTVDIKVESPRRAISRTTARILAEGMQLTVAEGTAGAVADPRLLAGKTGTAQNSQGAPHAWFIGFAPAVQPVVAFAILIEHGGAGARAAVPIALDIVRYVSDRQL